MCDDLIGRAQRHDERRRCARRRIDEGEPRLALLEKGCRDLAIGQHGIGLRPQRPQRPAEVGGARRNGPHALAGLPGIEIVVAGAIADEEQRAGGRPDRLADGRALAAGNAARLGEAAVGLHLGDEELRLVPGHVGQHPGDEGDEAAVGRRPREGVEVGAADEVAHGAGPPARERDRDNDVVRVLRAGRQTLGRREQPPAPLVNGEIGKAHIRMVRQPLRRFARHEAVDLLVLVVDEIDALARNQELAAAVLVHARAGRERHGQQFLGPPARARAHQGDAPALGRPSLAPIDPRPHALHEAELERLAGDRLGRDR
jgi:hypothetical protein